MPPVQVITSQQSCSHCEAQFDVLLDNTTSADSMDNLDTNKCKRDLIGASEIYSKDGVYHSSMILIKHLECYFSYLRFLQLEIAKG